VSEAPSAVELRSVLAYSPEVDSLRALAMIAVVAMHSKIFPMGWTGVWLFYVISGYVVTLSIARNHDRSQPAKGAAHFARQRIGRILPPYFAYVLVGIALSYALSAPPSAQAIASLFGFYHNVAMARGVGDFALWPVGHLWTISVEMQFYLVYGLIAYFLPLHVTKRILWCFVIMAPLGRLLVSAMLAGQNPEAAAYIIYSAPGLHFDIFAMGCLFAIARLTIPLERMLWPLVWLGCTAVVLYVVSFVSLNVFVREREGVEIVRDVVSGILYGQGREVFIYTALGLGSLALLALTLARHPVVQWFTGLPILQRIGRVSYGCYIYHLLCLNAAAVIIGGKWGGTYTYSAPQRVMVFVLGLALTVALAQLSWRFLEQPAAAAVKRFGSKAAVAGTGAP
jgi:peptidoglycan/LPS O-acetylase OafA/YrhL